MLLLLKCILKLISFFLQKFKSGIISHKIMFFWKKENGKAVRNSLTNLKGKTQNRPFPKKVSEIRNALILIQEKIPSVKTEFGVRASEEKSKPWIDARFDPEIDVLANDEVAAVGQFESRIPDYLSELSTVETEERDDAEKEKDLLALAELLEEEGKLIDTRDADIQRQIEEMERATLRERLQNSSASALPLHTSDGVSWRDIAAVVRQLGGWIESAGTHAQIIRFPRAERGIPLSADVRSNVIAGEIVHQLQDLFPKHKIPNRAKMADALSAGDIHVAA